MATNSIGFRVRSNGVPRPRATRRQKIRNELPLSLRPNSAALSDGFSEAPMAWPEMNPIRAETIAGRTHASSRFCQIRPHHFAHGLQGKALNPARLVLAEVDPSLRRRRMGAGHVGMCARRTRWKINSDVRRGNAVNPPVIATARTHSHGGLLRALYDTCRISTIAASL